METRIESGSRPGVRVLKLDGPFTINTVFDFQRAVRESPAAVTIIDLAGVPYMDSAALGSLLGLHVSCERDGRKYALVGISDQLITLFSMSGVDGFVVRFSSVSEAEAQLAGG